MNSFKEIDNIINFSKSHEINIQFIYKLNGGLINIFNHMSLDILNEWDTVKYFIDFNNKPIKPSEYFCIWYKYNSVHNHSLFNNKEIAINKFIKTINKRIEEISSFGNHVWNNLKTTLEHSKKEAINVIGVENTEHIKFIEQFTNTHIDIIESTDKLKIERFNEQKKINESFLYDISIENVEINVGFKKLLKYDFDTNKSLDYILSFKNLSKRFIEKTNNNFNILDKLHDELININIEYDERLTDEFTKKHDEIVEIIKEGNKSFLFKPYIGNNVLSHFRNNFFTISDPIIESKTYHINHGIKRGEEVKLFFETPCSKVIPHIRYKDELYKYFSEDQPYGIECVTKKYINCILFFLRYQDQTVTLSYNISDGSMVLRVEKLVDDDQALIDHISKHLKVEIFNYQIKYKTRFVITDMLKNDLLLQHIINLDPVIKKICHFHETKTSIVNKKLSKFWVKLYDITNHIYITNGNHDKTAQFEYKGIKLKTFPGQEYVIVSITNIIGYNRINIVKEIVKLIIQKYFFNVDEYMKLYMDLGVNMDMYNLYRITYKNRKASDLPIHLNQKSMFNDFYFRYRATGIQEYEFKEIIISKNIQPLIAKMGLFNQSTWNHQLWLDRLRKLCHTLYYIPITIFGRDYYNLENPWSIYEYTDPAKQFELSLPELSNKSSHVRCITNFTNLTRFNGKLQYDDPVLMKRFNVITFPMDYSINGVLHKVDYPKNYYYIANTQNKLTGFNLTKSDKIPIKFNVGMSGGIVHYKGIIDNNVIKIENQIVDKKVDHWNAISNLIGVKVVKGDSNIENCDIIEFDKNKLYINSIFIIHDYIKFKYKNFYSKKIKFDEIKDALNKYFNVKIHTSMKNSFIHHLVKLDKYSTEDDGELLATAIKTMFECFTLINVDIDDYIVIDDEAHYELIKYPFFLPSIISPKQIIDLIKVFIKGMIKDGKIMVNKYLKYSYQNFSNFVTSKTNIQNFELSMWHKPDEIVTTKEVNVSNIIDSTFNPRLNELSFNILRNKFIYMSNSLAVIESYSSGKQKHGVLIEDSKPVNYGYHVNGNGYFIEY